MWELAVGGGCWQRGWVSLSVIFPIMPQLCLPAHVWRPKGKRKGGQLGLDLFQHDSNRTKTDLLCCWCFTCSAAVNTGKLRPACAETLESHNSIFCLCFVNSLMINSWWVRSTAMRMCCRCVVVTLRPAHFSCSFWSLCAVNQQKLFFFCCMGVGSCNKAALCLMNLSHKYQLASSYATKTETYTESARCIWTCCHTSSTMWHKHLTLSPEHFVPTPPVPQRSHAPLQIECDAESEGRMVVIRGDYYSQSSPLSLNCPELTARLMSVTSFPVCLGETCWSCCRSC